MNYIFKADDHPEANGRQAQEGDVCYPMHFKTDEGSLTVELGHGSFVKIACVLLRLLLDNPELMVEVKEKIDDVEVKEKE